MKIIKQIDVCLNNEPGALSEVSNLLGNNGINIIAIYVTTQIDKGKIRFIANDPDRAVNVLKAAGYEPEVKGVIACEVPHHPGGLNVILKILRQVNINVDYLYPCIGTGDIAILILGAHPAKDALKVLDENWVRTFGEELYHMCELYNCAG